MLALAISDVTNPFYYEIIRGAQVAASEAGYTILLADTQESGAHERTALDRAVPTVEGIVLATTRMSDSAIRMTAKQRPVIVLNRAVSDVPCVITDNPRGMRRAVEHLAELGHQRITYLAGPEASWADGMRWRSLREAAVELELHVRRLGPFPPTVAGGAKAAAEFATNPTTAVIAYNDLVALGLLSRLGARGIPVPSAMSVVGCDDIGMSAMSHPSLTTVSVPKRSAGRATVGLLLSMLEAGADAGPVHRELPTQLIVRDTTAVATTPPTKGST